MDIHSLARLAGASVWVEQQLLGAAASSLSATADADTIRAGRWCAVHGEHIRRWAARMPSIPGIDADSLVCAPTGEIEVAATALHSVSGASSAAHRSRSAMLSLLAVQYREARAMVDPLVDGPTAHLLDDVIAATAALLDEVATSAAGAS